MAAKNVLERLLSPVEVRVTVPAAPEAVFAVLSDPETYPEWLAGAQHIRQVDDRFPRRGRSSTTRSGPPTGPPSPTTARSEPSIRRTGWSSRCTRVR